MSYLQGECMNAHAYTFIDSGMIVYREFLIQIVLISCLLMNWSYSAIWFHTAESKLMETEIEM